MWKLETALLTIESDKATMDVPSPLAGTVVELKVTVNDTVSEGDVLLTLEADGDEPAEAPAERARDGSASSLPSRNRACSAARARAGDRIRSLGLRRPLRPAPGA